MARYGPHDFEKTRFGNTPRQQPPSTPFNTAQNRQELQRGVDRGIVPAELAETKATLTQIT